VIFAIGPLHDPVTWYKIAHAGEQVAQWDFQNKDRSRWSGTSCIVLEVPLCNLLTSMCDFVPCDRTGPHTFNRTQANFCKTEKKIIKHALLKLSTFLWGRAGGGAVRRDSWIEEFPELDSAKYVVIFRDKYICMGPSAARSVGCSWARHAISIA